MHHVSILKRLYKNKGLEFRDEINIKLTEKKKKKKKPNKKESIDTLKRSPSNCLKGPYWQRQKKMDNGLINDKN